MQTQRLRRLALHVLFAWLFVLATGIVNACVVQAELPDAAHGGHALAMDGGQTTAHEMLGHDHDDHSGKAPCERCCDEPSVLPQQPAKQQTDTPGGFWLAALPASSFTSPALSRADPRLDSKQIRWGATIPIPIAFLRLTL